MENALNLRATKIYDTIYDENGKEQHKLNGPATEEAQAKQRMIEDAFKDWIFKDRERRESLVALYNEKFNCIRPREYDGSHIQFFGMNPEIALRPHQRNAIAHILYGRNTLLAHVVGAGKTYEMVAAAMEKKRLGLCSKTLVAVPNHYHANIRKALSDAVKLKLIPYNPAAEVERPKKDNFVASYYSADELMEVLPIFANTKMELPVMLAAFYGLRRSEVIGLQWSAIDFERKIVTISRTFERINVDGKMVDVSKCRTKNKSSFRSLPLIPAVEQALLKAQKRQRQQMKLCGNSYCKEYKDYICVDDMGHLVTPDYVTRVFREMLLKNGFRPIRYHDLRHSCASLLIKNKVTMKEVQMWLGHSSFSTTANIYAHIDVDSKMEAANMIASKINLGELPEKKKSPKRKIA